MMLFFCPADDVASNEANGGIASLLADKVAKVIGRNIRMFQGVQVEAWGPLGQGITGVLDDPAIREIAVRHGKSAAQIVLRWHMQRGLVTIPRCDNDAYTDENIRIFNFELSLSEMEMLDRNQRAYEQNAPDNFPW